MYFWPPFAAQQTLWAISGPISHLAGPGPPELRRPARGAGGEVEKCAGQRRCFHAETLYGPLLIVNSQRRTLATQKKRIPRLKKRRGTLITVQAERSEDAGADAWLIYGGAATIVARRLGLCTANGTTGPRISEKSKSECSLISTFCMTRSTSSKHDSPSALPSSLRKLAGAHGVEPAHDINHGARHCARTYAAH